MRNYGSAKEARNNYLKNSCQFLDVIFMIAVSVEQTIRDKYEGVRHELDERGRRMWAAAEARALGYGDISSVARVTGLDESDYPLEIKRSLTSSRPT